MHSSLIYSVNIAAFTVEFDIVLQLLIPSMVKLVIRDIDIPLIVGSLTINLVQWRDLP